MDVPPSRYRVVERGRRLEVIDTAAPAAPRVSRPVPREPGEPTTVGWLPKQVRFDGTRRWTTHPLYDGKGPRTVTIVPGAAPLGGWLGTGAAALALALLVAIALAPYVLIAVGAVLFNPKVRAQLRAWSTRAIDRIAQDGG